MDSKELKAWLRDYYPSYLRAPEGNGHTSKPRTHVSHETSTYSRSEVQVIDTGGSHGDSVLVLPQEDSTRQGL